MNKKMVSLLQGIIFIIVTVISAYFSNFDKWNLILGACLIIVLAINGYLTKSIESLEDDNDKISREKEKMYDDRNMLHEKIDSLKEQIQFQKNQISSISISANQGNPYIIQVVSNEDISKGIKKNKKYTLEIIISTIDKQYDIKYLSISFKQRIPIKQDGIVKTHSMYKLDNTLSLMRNGRYEYSFKLDEKYIHTTSAKCIFEIKNEQSQELNVIIQVNSELGINRTETIIYPLIDDNN